MKRSRAIALIAVLLGSAVVCAQNPAQAAPQAQESGAQKLLMRSIEMLDVAGVRTALDKGADPNYTKYGFSMIGTLATRSNLTYNPARPPFIQESPSLSLIWTEEKAVDILGMLFKAGAKLQPCDEGVLDFPISNGWSVFTIGLLERGASPTREILGMTPMEIATYHGQTQIIDLLKKYYGVPALEPRDAAQQRLIGAAKDFDIPAMEDAIDDGADVNGRNRQGQTALLVACRSFFGEVHHFTAIQYIIGKGADPAIQGCDDTLSQPCHKTTALHCVMLESPLNWKCGTPAACQNARNLEEKVRSVIKALLLHGGPALVSARDSDGKTPAYCGREEQYRRSTNADRRRLQNNAKG